MTIQELLKISFKQLEAKKISTASLDAEVLLAFALNKPKEFLYSHPQSKVTKLQENKFLKLIKRRTQGEPVAYLRNTKEFYGLDFYVDKRVLIPRPETELLVEETLRFLTVNLQPSTVSIADIGTGSGCIIISLAKILATGYRLPATSFYATDISKPALTVAKLNAKKHKVKIKFYQGNLLEPLKDKKINILIANLPYGWRVWKNNTSAETSSLKFEPQNALFTKENGLYLYRQLFKQLAKRGQKPKLIIGEFDPRQQIVLQNNIKKYLPQYRVEIKKDLAGLNRIVILSQ